MLYNHLEMTKIVAQYSQLRERADRIRKLRYRRAVKTYFAAFRNSREYKDGDILDCCVIHNSLVSLANGQPWPEVDYHFMRLAGRLVDDFTPSRLCSAFYERKTRELHKAQGRN